MSSINESLSRIASGLLNPKSQVPTLDQRFTQLTYEFQNFYNELENSGQPWSYNETSINVTSGQSDYLLADPPGKILFVIAYPENTAFGPVSLEIADLAGVTSDFFLFSPLDYGYSPDFNEAINFPFPFEIAFYRKDGDVYFRLPPFAYTLTSIKVVYATGDWLANLSSDSTAVLANHHALPETRAMLNLLPGCEWTDNMEADQGKRMNLGRSLTIQEDRYAKQFLYAKRSMSVDQTSTREAYGGNY